MLCPYTLRLPRRLLLAIATALLAATGSAAAQSCGTGGCAFWATEVNDSWFNPFRWGGILPWQGGVPNASVSCRIELAVQIDVLGQGQAASCHHLQFNHVGAVVRVAGSSTRAELNVHGTQMDNNGLILIGGQDALQDSSLIIHNHTNANGANGRIRLSAPPINQGAFLATANNLGWLLVNWPSHTIEGNGNIRVRLQNDGLIDANVAGRNLTFDGGHSVDNNSLVRARDGGSMVLAMPNGDFGFRQFGLGRIVVENGSGLGLFYAGDQGLRGGRLQTVGSGVATVLSQGFRIEDVHLESGSRLTFSGNAGLIIGPLGLQNDGLIQTGPQGFVTSRFGASTTLTGTGRLQLEGGALSALFGGGGQALVNAPGHTIGGHGNIALALTNQGIVLADRNGQTSGPGELTLQTSAQINEGALVARNGGTIRLFSTTLTQGSLGVVRAEQDSAFVLESASTVSGGTLATSGNGLIFPNTTDARLEDLTLAAGSHLNVACARVLTLLGTINNAGTVTLDNGGCGSNSAVVRGNALIADAGEVRLAANSATINTTLQGNDGVLRLGTGQLLTGSGRIGGAVEFQGTLMTDQPYAPPGPAGELNVAGTLTLTASSVWMVDLASAASFDRISGAGTVNLNGVLAIASVGGFVPAPGATFDLITAGQVNGNFRRIEFPLEYAELDGQVEIFPDRVRLTIIPPMFRDGFE